MLSSASELFAENVLTQVSLYLISLLQLIWNCMIFLYLYLYFLMLKKVIMNLDLSKASGLDCIPVVVLKNCEPELSCILANSSISVLRSVVFQIVGRFHQWSLYLRMLGKVYS